MYAYKRALCVKSTICLHGVVVECSLTYKMPMMVVGSDVPHWVMEQSLFYVFVFTI